MNEIADKGAEEASQQKRKQRSSFVVLLTILAAVCANLLFSNEYACMTIPAGLLALFIGIILRIIPIRSPRFALMLAIVLGSAAGVAFRVNPKWAFKESFGFEMPPEVRDFRVLSRHYEGGGGDHTMFMEFHADKGLIESLVQRAGFCDDTDNIRRWREQGGGWDHLEACFLQYVLSFGHHAWRRIPPIAKPRLFSSQCDFDIHLNTLLIVDEDSDRVIVVNRR